MTNTVLTVEMLITALQKFPANHVIVCVDLQRIHPVPFGLHDCSDAECNLILSFLESCQMFIVHPENLAIDCE